MKKMFTYRVMDGVLLEIIKLIITNGTTISHSSCIASERRLKQEN